MNARLVGFAAMLSSMALSSSSPGSPGSSIGTVEIDCVGFKNETGEAVCALFDNADDFPEGDRVYAGMTAKIDGRRAFCRFSGIPRGRYAAAVFHDEDGDRKLKKRMGRPVEGFGFSNDAKLRTFGPPKFDAAAFDFDGEYRRLTINIRYP